MTTCAESKHHRDIINQFYINHPEIQTPNNPLVYKSWGDLINNPTYLSKTLIFVDGGITDCDVDVGEAILLNDGGIIKHNIICGLFYKDGGIISEGVYITQRLKGVASKELNPCAWLL